MSFWRNLKNWMKKSRTPNTDNRDDRNKTSNKLEQYCDNKEKLKVDEQIKLQKKCSEQVKPQNSPCSSTNYEHNEKARDLRRSKSATHEKKKEVSMFATKRRSFDSSSALRFDTYKKRPGTTNEGKYYEELMCALLALKFSTSESVADFEMTTNSDDCGDFDDVELTVTFVDGHLQIFLLQLKHSENMKNVTKKKLEAENGDFSVLKYIRSISKFENIENVSFILYTNSRTSIKDESTIYLKNEDNTNEEEVVVRALQELDSEKCLLWSKNEKNKKIKKNNTIITPQTQEKETNVFQFELNQSSGSVEGLDYYLKRFYFFAHQANAKGAHSLINAILREECGINDATYSSSFIQFMETWWSGNFILTKYDVVAKLAELTLTPFIQTISDRKCNEKSKLLQEAIMKFDMTIVRDTNEEVIANIWNDTASDDEISFTSLKYGLRPKVMKDISAKERSKVLWHLNKVPLIVKADDCHKQQINHAIRLLEKVKKKKVVLLANATKEEFPGWRIFQDLSDLPNKGVYAAITKNFKVSLQGRKSIFLHQLLNFNQENSRTIETAELIKMTQEVVQIGKRRENKFENYIPRSVSTMTFDITKMSQFCKRENSLLIICNVSQPWNEAIRQLDLHVMELDQYLKLDKKKKCHVLLTSNKWPEVSFNDICKKTKKNVHLLQVFDDKSCTSVLSKEKRFSLEIMKSEGARVDEMKIFTYLDHPLNVICSPPGMGKSTLMSRLISNCPFSYWSVRINLINHKTIFKEKCKHDEILQYFVEEEEEDPLAVKIRSMLLQNQRMYFFLDGLDEIDSDSVEIALQFIKHISSLGHRVWIASRQNLEQTVSRSLNIFPIKIEDLTEKQQKVYIQERLQDFYQKNEAEHITNKIYANVDIINSRHLLGAPLQLFMVTENFRDNKDLWREPEREIFVLTKMYKIFFQGKKKHQHRKLGVDKYEDQLGFNFDQYLEQCELPALESCLDTTTFDKLNINLDSSKKFLEKFKNGDPFGIVSGVTDDNHVIFYHQTYAEYFACVWLKNNLDKVSLLQDELFNKKNQNLRLIFDIMLVENSPLHLAVIYRDTDLISKHIHQSEAKDKGGRSPLQLLCTYGVEHRLLQKIREDISEEIYRDNKIEGVSTQYREIFEMLSHCNIFQNDDIFGWNCLDFAIEFKNLFAIEKFLERFGDSINLAKLFEHYDIGTLAYYSSQMGYPNLLRAAIKKNSKALSVKYGTWELTLLHVAIKETEQDIKFGQILMEKRIKVITTLIECGLDVNQRCDRGRTPLYLASELNDDVIAKLLLDRGANINFTDATKSNVLHHVLRSSNPNTGMVKLLTDRGIDVEARDDNRKSPLQLCCRKGHYDALVTLLENGAHVNAKDSLNRTAIYDAILVHNFNCTKVLLDNGADINAVDNSGETVLYAAFKTFNRENHKFVKMLLDHGVDIHAVNNSGETVLHVAVKTYNEGDYNCNCVKMLIDHGAEVNAVDNSGNSVLHTAVKTYDEGNYNCIKMLLDQGADINAVCYSEKTVLHAAFEEPDYSPEIEVIQLLLSRGVDANKRDKEQKTALDYAVIRRGSYVLECSRYEPSVKILFDATAHDQLMSTDHVTFLHYAVFDGNYVAVKLFLEGGLNLDNIDINNEEYPLYFAAENEHPRSDLLLKMTKFIRDHKRNHNKFYAENYEILEPLKEYFSKDSVCADL